MFEIYNSGCCRCCRGGFSLFLSLRFWSSVITRYPYSTNRTLMYITHPPILMRIQTSISKHGFPQLRPLECSSTGTNQSVEYKIQSPVPLLHSRRRRPSDELRAIPISPHRRASPLSQLHPYPGTGITSLCGMECIYICSTHCGGGDDIYAVPYICPRLYS